MIVAKWTFTGRVASKKNGKRIVSVKRRNGIGRGTAARKRPILIPSKRHEDWHKDCMIQLLSMMKPNVPISRTVLVKVKVFYPDFVGLPDNTNKVESIHDLFVDAGIVKDDNFKVFPSTHQDGLYRKNKPGFEIYITIDENHPENSGLDLSTLPLI